MPTKKALPKSNAVAVRSEDPPAFWQKFARTIIAVNPPSAMTAVWGVCFIAVVVMKTIHPNLEIYSLLVALLVLALSSLAKIGPSNEQ